MGARSSRTAGRTRAGSAELRVGDVVITSSDRVVFEGASITKGEVAEYYRAIAPRMLPHIANRPLSLLRCPQGAASTCFYQKHWTGVLPRGVKPIDIAESDGESGQYVFVTDEEGLVSLAQYGVLEFHPWGSRVDDVEAPDRIVFDLDPAPEVSWDRVVDTALTVREVLEACELKSWVKTTGGKGLHVVVPITRHSTWDEVREFSRMMASRLVAADPAGLVDVASKAARTGRIFIDYMRNSRGATSVAPWSTRARDCGPIAVPHAWREVQAMQSAPSTCLATMSTVVASRNADPWSDMMSSRQRLTKRVLQALRAQP